jgi:hypothetical protein
MNVQQANVSDSLSVHKRLEFAAYHSVHFLDDGWLAVVLRAPQQESTRPMLDALDKKLDLTRKVGQTRRTSLVDAILRLAPLPRANA